MTFLGALPALLDLASPIALNAVFAASAMTFDVAYIVAIILWVPYLHCDGLLLIPSCVDLSVVGFIVITRKYTSNQALSTWATDGSVGL